IWIVSPEFPYYVRDALNLPAAKQAALGLGIVLLLAFAGFLLYITNSWFRRLFESGMLPLLAGWFRRWQQGRLQDLQEQISNMRPEVVDYRREVRDGAWYVQLRDARAQGRLHNGVGPPTPDLLEGVDDMERLRSANERVPFTRAERTFRLLVDDLQAHNADAV